MDTKTRIIIFGFALTGLVLYMKRNEITEALPESVQETLSDLQTTTTETISDVAGTVSDKVKQIFSRGIRNNNPGNIRKSGESWQGLAEQQTDSSFFTFSDPVYGIRALTKILKNYRANYGLNTITGIINRWAPPTENNTRNYINFVSGVVGKPANETLIFPDDLPRLVDAIITMENGGNPYDAQTLTEGIRLAYV